MASTFAALHHPDAGTPLLLPNAWDHASAAALAAQGFAAIGTTSLGVAAAAGLRDGSAATRDASLALALALGQGPFLLSVDAEGGFSDDPAEVAEIARELAAVGAVGINLEDGRADGTLVPAELHAEKITAVKAAVPGLFVNARTDTHWLGDGGGDGGGDGDGSGSGFGLGLGLGRETVRRLDAYQLAGADGVFVPGLSDPARIAWLVKALDVPLNILYSPKGPPLPALAELGVRRVSLGSLLYRRALGAAVETAALIRAGLPVEGPAPTYDEVQALVLLPHGAGRPGPVPDRPGPVPDRPGAAPSEGASW
ncbi:isocitrate lyase/phosphoenolpyruvate mutase family protein [Streptomyces dioscori]|uniref:Isocitrate lyase/phosphoenolpyruvate mutase family protein n=1 Tax=Streptomyces dioscori TaxID=2109333 RepID=A0A2P8Q9A8_9ACTN|nr:isocitrate lyase/phosphoenolpyruvate mutase family protein [Streptomyces dioscori]PSM42819.1 isocitrate lyase/phosphoenolpyruvate mutase family protein [Streptomyces dioscori]